jgi:predicted kinase
MVNTDKELKYLLNKYGFGTDLDILPDEVFKNLTDPTSKNYSGLRTFAKELTGVRKNQYMNGRLGMIIDGTGDDFKEIRKQKREVEKLGYDTYMIFINTSLDIALQRNEKRDRVLPISVVKNSHREVVKNIGGYQGLFGGSNFLVIDNNKDLDEKSAQKRFNMLVKRGLSKFVNKPIRNKIGKGWVSKNKILKKMTKESFKELVSERKESYRKIAKELIKKYRVYSKLGFKTGATKGSYDFDNNKIWLRPYYSYKKDFLLTILHEIYHAMDSKRFGRKEFVRRYQKAGDVLVNNGYDFHNDNPFEIAAEKWARREINKYK